MGDGERCDRQGRVPERKRSQEKKAKEGPKWHPKCATRRLFARLIKLAYWHGPRKCEKENIDRSISERAKQRRVPGGDKRKVMKQRFHFASSPVDKRVLIDELKNQNKQLEQSQRAQRETTANK